MADFVFLPICTPLCDVHLKRLPLRVEHVSLTLQSALASVVCFNQ